MDRVGLFERHAVDVNNLVLKMNVISRHADHAFHQIGGRIQRVAKHNDVTAMNGAVGKHVVPGAILIGKVKFVGEQEITAEQRVLHGFGRNPAGLNHEGDDEYYD